MIGNSVAYHLVQRGWSDIVIIDKGGVADGTSSESLKNKIRHGSGMLGLFRPKHERAIVQYCIDLYQSLQEQGYDLGLEHCGSINVAASKDRMTSIERKVSEVLAFLAHQGGAKFVSGCGVKRVVTASSTAPSTLLPDDSTKNVRVSGIETELGHISCEYFVNCAGIWAREIGRMCDTPVRIPVCPAEHFFMTFKPLQELKNAKLPNVRDYDAHVYVRQLGDRYMMGAFETLARPWDVTKHGIDPD